ncbi:MAG: hypothetical protein K2L95_00705 [Alphaproteobacteria bacterium]|nr:hypothetical protein [Alphaproteobacteria bacterium]
MTKFLVLVSVICVMPYGAHAKFSAGVCDSISQCCNGFDNSDDSDGMEAACCGSYGGSEFYDCWEVCIRGISNQYCEQTGSAYHCRPGQGYDEIEGWCETCGSGYYSELATWEGEYGDTITDYTCRPCPRHWVGSIAVQPSGPNASTSISKCFISGTSVWGFSDSAGSGEINFQSDCYYK